MHLPRITSSILFSTLCVALLVAGCDSGISGPEVSEKDSGPVVTNICPPEVSPDCCIGIDCDDDGAEPQPELSGDTDINGPLNGTMFITGWSEATRSGSRSSVEVLEVTTGGVIIEGSGSCTTEQETVYDSGYVEATPYCLVQDAIFSNQDEAGASSTHYLQDGSLEITKYSSDTAAF